MAIRVLRILEYTYVDETSYIADRHHWTDSLACAMMEMRSVVLVPDEIEWASHLPDPASIRYILDSNLDASTDVLVNKLTDLFQ